MKNKKMIIIITVVLIILILFVWKIYPSLKGTGPTDLSFNVKSNNVELLVGNQEMIEYELNENLTINWESNNEDVVTVDNGMLTGIGLGDAIVKGTVTKDNKTITRSITVSTYYGDKNVVLNDVIVPDGELFITSGTNYKIDINYSPIDGYITSVDYRSMNSDVADFSNGIVNAKKVGTTTIIVEINKTIVKSINVHVIEKSIEPVFSSKIESIDFSESEIVIKPGETKEIKYSITPENAFITNTLWESVHEEIVTVNDGIITAKQAGESTIRLTINDLVSKEIKVVVTIPVTGLTLNTPPKVVLKVGGKETISTTVSPSNATSKTIKYTNSNPSAASVSQTGVITGLSSGSGIITIKTEDGNYQKTVSYVVNQTKGTVSGTGGIWGYDSTRDVTPTRADKTFFQQLANSGKGVLSGNVYIYNNGKKSYKYDISSSTLTVDNLNILMRIYYPKGYDLSYANTYTFFGGTGPAVVNFGDFMKHLDDNRNEMSSSGIMIMVSTNVGSRYSSTHAIHSTEFVQSIVSQKSGVKNTIGGYSGSGPYAGNAANDGPYDRLIIFDSMFHANLTTNLVNKEIVVYSPVGDKLVDQTRTTLNYLKSYKYTNVTLVTNNSSLISSYGSSFLVINPGSQMGSGHVYANIIKARVFSYACS